MDKTYENRLRQGCRISGVANISENCSLTRFYFTPTHIDIAVIGVAF